MAAPVRLGGKILPGPPPFCGKNLARGPPGAKDKKGETQIKGPPAARAAAWSRMRERRQVIASRRGGDELRGSARHDVIGIGGEKIQIALQGVALGARPYTRRAGRARRSVAPASPPSDLPIPRVAARLGARSNITKGALEFRSLPRHFRAWVASLTRSRVRSNT